MPTKEETTSISGLVKRILDMLGNEKGATPLPTWVAVDIVSLIQRVYTDALYTEVMANDKRIKLERKVKKLKARVKRLEADISEPMPSSKVMEEEETFRAYFNVADELTDPRMHLHELDYTMVGKAAHFASRQHQPWPPLFTAAENWRNNDHRGDSFG